MDITNRIIVALLERMKSRNKNFSLSRPKFHQLFQINPDGYLWYGKKLERHLLNKYGESADTLKYLDMYYFIDNIVRLYYMPKKFKFGGKRVWKAIRLWLHNRVTPLSYSR